VAVPWNQDGRSGVAYHAEAITGAGENSLGAPKNAGPQGRS
jgi:hypothetical protein